MCTDDEKWVINHMMLYIFLYIFQKIVTKKCIICNVQKSANLKTAQTNSQIISNSPYDYRTFKTFFPPL